MDERPFTPEEIDEQNRKIQDKISELVEIVDPGSMVSTYVFAVKAIDKNGQDGFHTFYTPGMKSWDRLGMIHFLDHQEKAEGIAHLVVDHLQ